jgi:hypothetical protein
MDLATLYYVTFIKPFDMLPTETLSFDSEQFTDSYTKKVFESKNNDHFLLLKEHFFDAVVLYKKKYEI